MADFKVAYNATSIHEGGYANNALDRGGETWKGISRKNFPKWKGWEIVDMHRYNAKWIEMLTESTVLESLVQEFYKDQFWYKLELTSVINQAIANELFDTAVNCGVGTASTFLQRALNFLNRFGKDYPNLPVDGIVGHRTIATLNNHQRPKDVLKVLNILQGARYIAICEARESQEVFASGWLTRVTL